MDTSTPLLDFDSVIFGRYRLLECLRRSPQAEVWKARNVQDPLSGQVVLKVFPCWGEAGEGYQQRVRADCERLQTQARGALQPPLGYMEEGPLFGLILPLLHGNSLQSEMEQAGAPPLGFDDLRLWLPGLCQRLDALADAGLLHRNLKPHNLWRLVDGSVVLLDFGAGDFLIESGAQLEEYAPERDPARWYRAPERAAGGTGDRRSDIFSLAGTLYFLLTGERPEPFDPIAAIGRVQFERDRLAEDYGLEPDPRIEAWEPFLLLGLRPDPAERPARFTDLLKGFEGAQDLVAELAPSPEPEKSAIAVSEPEPLPAAEPLPDPTPALTPDPVAPALEPAAAPNPVLPPAPGARSRSWVLWLALLLFLTGGAGGGYWFGVAVPARASATAHAAILAEIDALSVDQLEEQAGRVRGAVEFYARSADPARAGEARHRLVERLSLLEIEAARIEAERLASLQSEIVFQNLPPDTSIRIGERGPFTSESGTLTVGELPLGSYPVELEAPGYAPLRLETVVVGEGGPTVLDGLPFEELLGQALIEVKDGEGVTVEVFWLEDREVGTEVLASGPAPFLFEKAEPGFYVASAIWPNGHSQRVDFGIYSGETSSVYLEIMVGFVSIRSEPEGAEIWSFDELLGHTPVEDFPLDASSYWPIVLRLEDHEEVELEARFEPGERLVLHAVLPVLPTAVPEAVPPFQPTREYYSLSEVEQKPTARQAVAPEYPRGLLRREVTGSAKVRVQLDAAGAVVRVDVEEATHPDFGKAAEAAVRASRYAPAEIQGVPVGCVFEQVFQFKLD